MGQGKLRFTGVELYFDDLNRAKEFYETILGLEMTEQDRSRYAKFDSGSGFVCLERKGSEPYPSDGKAVVFFEVADIESAIHLIGRDRFIHIASTWAVLRDPEGYNVVLIQQGNPA